MLQQARQFWFALLLFLRTFNYHLLLLAVSIVLLVSLVMFWHRLTPIDHEIITRTFLILDSGLFGLISLRFWEISRATNRKRNSVAITRHELRNLYQFAKLGQLTGGIIHDIANPLTIATLHLENLRDRQPIPEVESALASTLQIQQFIKAARDQMRHQESMEEIMIPEIIRAVMQMVSYRAKQQEVELIVDCPAKLKYYGNAVRVQQVLVNLISNAIDSYDNLPSRSDRLALILVTVRDRELVIYVKDYGCGIKPRQLKQIFEPFFTTKAAHQGTGIGLSITKEIVENELGGTIKVVSSKSGTTFRVSLPNRVKPKG